MDIFLYILRLFWRVLAWLIWLPIRFFDHVDKPEKKLTASQRSQRNWKARKDYQAKKRGG